MNKNSLQFFESGIFYILSFFLPMFSWGYFLFFDVHSIPFLKTQQFHFLQNPWVFFFLGSLFFSIILFTQNKVANAYLYYVSKTNLALFSLSLYFLPPLSGTPHMMSLLIGIPIVFIVIHQLLSINDKGLSLSNYFLSAFLVSSLIVFNTSFVALALLPLLAIFIYNHRSLRHLILVLLGLLLPFLYAWVYLYFFQGRSLNIIFQTLVFHPLFSFDIIHQLPFWSIVLFLIFSIFNLFQNMPTMKIRLRKTYIMLLLTVVLLLATIVLFPATYNDVYFILLPFATIIIGRYFIFLKRRRFNTVLFLIFIIIPIIYLFNIIEFIIPLIH